MLEIRNIKAVDHGSEIISRSSHQRCSIKKAVLKIFPIFTEKNCAGVSFS